jgi:thioredoxin 1
MATVLPSLTAETLDEEINGTDLPVLVDVWTEWCPPCKTLEPVLASIADEQSGIRVFKLNGDEHPEVLTRFGIMSVPTMLVFDDGQMVKRLVGARGKGHLLQELSDLLS